MLHRSSEHNTTCVCINAVLCLGNNLPCRDVSLLYRQNESVYFMSVPLLKKNNNIMCDVVYKYLSTLWWAVLLPEPPASSTSESLSLRTPVYVTPAPPGTHCLKMLLSAPQVYLTTYSYYFVSLFLAIPFHTHIQLSSQSLHVHTFSHTLMQ